MTDELVVSANEGRLRLIGKFTVRDIRRPIRALHCMIHDGGYRSVEIDFGEVAFTHAPPMLALLADIQRHRHDGVNFSFKLPDDTRVNRLFVNSNWAHFLDPEHFGSARNAPGKHSPTKQYCDPSQQGAIVDEVVDTLLKSFTDFGRDHLKAIEWSLNEITDNVLTHAISPIGGYVQVTALKNRKLVEFVVVDSGIGIPSTLRASRPEINSDVDAVAQAIQEGVTRDPDVGQGNGLFGSYQIAVSSGGYFGIHSNRATLYYTEKTGMHARAESAPFLGSLVVCGIDYTSPLLLERALRFRDTPHIPLDRIDTHYETGARGELLFVIREETSSVGSRPAGANVRQKLENLIRLTNADRIIVDFENVHLISSSFADEVFGKLFITLGAIHFSSKFEFRNCDQLVRKLIDKAITQRVAAGVR
jgi:hypothetical protein